MKGIKWAPLIPLIGGFPLGAFKAIGAKPHMIYSYDGFQGHDTNLTEYWNDVPYMSLDSEAAPKSEKYDLIVMTPPCSALSSLNSQSSAEYESIKWVYRSAEDALGRFDATVAMGENAPRLFTVSGIKVQNALLDIAKKYNRSLMLVKTDTYLHGIPQHRHRTFYVFFKSDKCPNIVMPNVDSPDLSVYLKDIPKNATYQKHYTHGFDKLEDVSGSYNWMIKQFGKNFRDHIDGCKSVTSMIYKNPEYVAGLMEVCEEMGDKDTLRMCKRLIMKLAEGKGVWDNTIIIPNSHINAVQGRVLWNGIHPKKDRWMNVREWMHLMGLPHDMNLAGIDSSPKVKINGKNINMIAQNVPTCTSRDMVTAVLPFIRNESDMSNYSFVKYNDETKLIEGFDGQKFVKMVDSQPIIHL